jgi:hypothetical protein
MFRKWKVEFKIKVMKHPGYSKAKNQYAGRAVTKLSKEKKVQLNETMKAFIERLKTLNR